MKTGTNSIHRTVPVLGLHKTNKGKYNSVEYVYSSLSLSLSLTSGGGHIVVYGDSNCIDSAHLQSGNVYSIVYLFIFFYLSFCHIDCFWLLDELIQYCTRGIVPVFVSPSLPITQPVFLPERMEGNNLILITVFYIQAI